MDGVVPKAPSPLPYGQPAVKASVQLPEVTISSPEKLLGSSNNANEVPPRQPSPAFLMGGAFEYTKPVSRTPSNEKGKRKTPDKQITPVRNRRSSSFSEGQEEIIETAKLALLEAEKLVIQVYLLLNDHRSEHGRKEKSQNVCHPMHL